MADPVADQDLYPGDTTPVSAPAPVDPVDQYPGETSPGGSHKDQKDGLLESILHPAKGDEEDQIEHAAGAGIAKSASQILSPVAFNNTLAGFLGPLYKKATGEDAPDWLIHKYETASPEHILSAMQAAGIPTQVPNPKDPAQRYTAAVTGSLAYAPTIPSALAGVASQAAGDAGLPGWAQLASGVLASLSPQGARALLQKVLQINPATAQANIANVEATGGKATLGQAAGPGTNAQVIEDAISKIPGPAGVIRSRVAQNNDAATQTINDIADQFNAPTSKNAAGGLVQNTLEQSTVPDIRAKVGAAYQARAAAVPKGTQVDVSNLLDTINEQAAKNPNFRAMLPTTDPKTGQLVGGDPVLREIYQKLRHGAGWTQTKIGGRIGWIKPDNTISFEPPPANTKLAFEDADNLAQQVGQMVDQSYNKAATTNIVNGALSQVNQQFRRDISAGIKDIPGAAAADKNATTVYLQGEAQKAQLRKVLNSDDNERVYDMVVSGAKDAEGRLDAVFRGLPADQQNVVAATIMRRMGVAVPSKQNAAGEAWSSETFLSNWNKISDGSKAILLRNMPQEYRQNLDAIAQYAENIRKGSSVYGNPSGTGSKIAQLKGVTTTLGATAGVASGILHMTMPHVAIATLGPYAGLYMTARVMANPNAVKWLAASTRLPASSVPIIASQLNKVAQQSGDPDVAKLAAAFGQANQQQNQQ